MYIFLYVNYTSIKLFRKAETELDEAAEPGWGPNMIYDAEQEGLEGTGPGAESAF